MAQTSEQNSSKAATGFAVLLLLLLVGFTGFKILQNHQASRESLMGTFERTVLGSFFHDRTSPSVLVDNPAMAQQMLPLEPNVQQVSCVPIGLMFGWTCDAVIRDVGPDFDVRMELQGDPSTPSEKAIYQGGLAFTIDKKQDPSIPVALKMSMDPSKATFNDTMFTIGRLVNLAQQQGIFEAQRTAEARLQMEKNREQALEDAKTPAQRAQENIATWTSAQAAATAKP